MKDDVHPAVDSAPSGSDMAKLSAPYMRSFKNGDGSVRYYFEPKHEDRKKGWATVRLCDKSERPIRDPLLAAQACRQVVAIYTAWRAGEPGAGPHHIDILGRVIAQNPVRQVRHGHRYMPGQIGAMVAAYMAHDVFTSNAAKTQNEYRTYLGLFVEKFGDTYWHRLAPGAARTWLKGRADKSGPSGAHALYRTARAFFGQVRLCYDDVDHPGFVPEERNPFASLNLSLPRAPMILWPREAVAAFVALADAKGQPSIGDAIVMMSWLGVRRQDWIKWPATVFDQDLLSFTQEKTGKPLVIPWTIVPPLTARVAAAKARRTANWVSSATFFHDQQGLPWTNHTAFRTSFNKLRDELAKQHPSFATRYYVGLDPVDPLTLPTEKLTMRTMRHTCITLLHDAEVPRDMMPAISGHEPKSIDDVLAHYTARTADQAAAVLNMRMAHETKGTKT